MDMQTLQKATGLQKQMKKMQDELANTHIEAESNGLVITFDGTMNIVKVDFETEAVVGNKEAIGEAIKESFSKATRKIQEISAEKMSKFVKSSGINPSEFGI